MLKEYLVRYRIDREATFGIAVVVAKDMDSAISLLRAQGTYNGDGYYYQITEVVLINDTDKYSTSAILEEVSTSAGYSAYEIAKKHGYTGDEAEWLLSLKGKDGAQGPMGPQGPQGDVGPRGARGEKGDRGATGPRGYTGATGAQGPQGEMGPTGPKGATGPMGLQGPRGIRGEKGEKGLDGKDAACLVPITYAELVNLKEEGRLSPGTYYRIIDYVTKVNPSYCKDIYWSVETSDIIESAEHPFDVIVQALSINTISEDAKAIHREGDTYFQSSNLAAWNLRYSLDNSFLPWAASSEAGGKGVIYRLVDEFNNDLPFDFKNIKHLPGDGLSYYTFSGSFGERDTSLSGEIYNNSIALTQKEEIPRYIFTGIAHSNIIIGENAVGKDADDETVPSFCIFQGKCMQNNINVTGITKINTTGNFIGNTIKGTLSSITSNSAIQNCTFTVLGSTDITVNAQLYACTIEVQPRNKMPLVIKANRLHWVHIKGAGYIEVSNGSKGGYLTMSTINTGMAGSNIYLKETRTTSLSNRLEGLEINILNTGENQIQVDTSSIPLSSTYKTNIALNSSGAVKIWCEADKA